MQNQKLQTLVQLLSDNFGKKEFYTAEEVVLYTNVNLNCCEKILRGGNIAYNLGIEEISLRVSSPFGGGMGVGSVCGAISGALMVLGILFSNPIEKACSFQDEITIPFLDQVKSKLNSLECKDLKPRYQNNEPHNCDGLIITVASILDETVRRLKEIK